MCLFLNREERLPLRLLAVALVCAGLGASAPGRLGAYVDVPQLNLPELGQNKEAGPTPAQLALDKIAKLQEEEEAYSKREDQDYLASLADKLAALEKGDKSGLVSAKECWALVDSSELKSWRKTPLPPEGVVYVAATKDKAAAKKAYEEKAALGEGVALLMLKNCSGFKGSPESAAGEFVLFFAKKSKLLSVTP